MKLLLLLGDHPRHLYFYKNLKKKYNILTIIMKRENLIPKLEKNLSKQDSKNFKNHFLTREKKEKFYFGNLKTTLYLKDENFFLVPNKGLNTPKVKKIIKQFNPDKCLIFGTQLIKKPLFSILPEFTLNIHLGLSPYYRGSATLFWPFYFLQPDYAGVTIHKITNKIDSGDILHQVTLKAKPNDGIHDVSCKLIKKTCSIISKIISVSNIKKIKFFKQEGYGKVFLKKDFSPEHLRVIYNVFTNKYKNFNRLKRKTKKPKIINFFR